MSNFRLNLPIDIPWTLVNCSEDMMDKTFCDKKMPSPFRSSISLYTYDPKVEDIPEEYSKCGKHITYLKVSCSITGYQPTGEEQQQIIDLLTSINGVDYSKIDEIIREYFGCYGVLLNVSVHPDVKDKDNIDRYPHIIDFEPKIRDFYQSASETGEVLTSSVNKVSTNKSFGSTDSTQNSWNAGATVRIPEESANIGVAGVGEVGASKGSPGEIRGDTGNIRTETDQRNWGITTDASRERREGQSTTTQLSQMYNLLTGYHSGTNRASFVMLPRPHTLQPTNERTFVQGLRYIEGIQDFFFIVLRNSNQPILNVDAFLQTGHFSEKSESVNIPIVDQFDFKTLTFNFSDFIDENDKSDVINWKKSKHIKKSFTIHDLDNEWVVDSSRGNNNSGVEEIINSSESSFLTDFTGTDTIRIDIGRNRNNYQNEDTSITGNQLLIECDIIVGWDLEPRVLNKTTFNRTYKVFLKKKKVNSKPSVAHTTGLLITQRKLCTQIIYNECISSRDMTTFKLRQPDVEVPLGPLDGIVIEVPFDITPLYDIPVAFDKDALNPKIKQPIPRSRNDFAFKKGIIRMIQNSMLSASNSPMRNNPGTVGYLQSKHFQKRLLQILPKEVLESPIHDFAFINPKVKDKVSKDVSFKEILTKSEFELSTKYKVDKSEILHFLQVNSDKNKSV